MFPADPLLTVSEWADRHRWIPHGTSAEPGRWRTERAPYLREIMDALGDPDVERVIFMKCARIGGTETILNLIGYHVHQQPTAIGVMQQTVEEAKGFSKEQLMPMLRATPCLRGKVKDSGRRDSTNTLQTKLFPGGALYLVGGNSATGLRRRSIQVIVGDEVDGYGITARGGTVEEGDPFTLFIKRSENFPARTIFETSTPTVKGTSRIERDYELSDQRVYLVPCPHCGYEQVLRWRNFRWENRDPQTVAYICGDISDDGELTAGCGDPITEEHKERMVRAGRWEPRRPGRRVRGYWIWAAYSLFTTWQRIVEQWLEAQGDQLKLQVFANTVWAETWEERGEVVEEGALLARREEYTAEVPKWVGVLTAGVDVQGDRLEVSVWGFGAGLERGLIKHQVLWGVPAKAEVWQQLALFLSRDWIHESGTKLRIRCTCIDLAGHHTEEVYRFCRAHRRWNVYPVRGSPVPGSAATRLAKSHHKGVRIVTLGTEALKDMVFAALRIQVPGPGYVHLPFVSEEYLRQLTAEVARTRYYRGRPVRRYERRGYIDAEALDCAVYAHAALLLLGPVRDRLGRIVEKLQEDAGEKEDGKSEAPKSRAQRRQSRRGWIDQWRN